MIPRALLSWCLLLLPAVALSGEAVPDPLDALMQPYTGNVPGAAVLVLHRGEAVVRRGYGLADLATAAPVTPATAFRLASVSKQFTAAAVLLLVEEGRIGLDDRVRHWFPELPPATAAITVHHLLSHTSGLVDYEDLMPAGATEQITDAGVLALLEDVDRLYFAPGSSYRYSNGAYALLALLVERASGRDYAGFLHERIFAPLGMDGSVAHVEGRDTVPARAFGHSRIDGQWHRTDQSSTSAVLGDGGIYSSINDLARWDAALYDDRLLSDASRTLAFSAQTTTATGEDDVDAYGYGWRIDGNALWHSGETIGFRNVIVRLPDERLTVVVLSNRNDPEPYRLARRIARMRLAGEI